MEYDEVIQDAYCGDCGTKMTQVGISKYQCPYCELEDIFYNQLLIDKAYDALKKQDTLYDKLRMLDWNSIRFSVECETGKDISEEYTQETEDALIEEVELRLNTVKK